MRYGPDDTFWIVIDPQTHEAKLEDVMFETSLSDLKCQFERGLGMKDNPVFFTEEKEAEIEAYGRLTVKRAFQALLNQGDKKSLRDGVRLTIFDGDDRVLFESDIVKDE